jgi:hypothetical protein
MTAQNRSVFTSNVSAETRRLQRAPVIGDPVAQARRLQNLKIKRFAEMLDHSSEKEVDRILETVMARKSEYTTIEYTAIMNMIIKRSKTR